MRYSLKIEHEASQAKTKLDYLISKGVDIELTEKKPIRSISQNSYLHLILSAFGCNFGYTLDEVKLYIFKKEVNAEIFYIGQKGKLIEVEEWRSTADLDTKEMTTAIERFLNYSAKNGYRLPEPSDLVWIAELKKEVHNNKQYL